MRTTWVGVPRELRDAATPLLKKYDNLMPTWVRDLEVVFDEEMDDAHATVLSDQVYGRVKLSFGSGWLTCDERKREWVVAHELSHTQLAPLERAWEEMMEGLPKRMRLVAERRFENALEESVSGLAYALVKEIE